MFMHSDKTIPDRSRVEDKLLISHLKSLTNFRYYIDEWIHPYAVSDIMFGRISPCLDADNNWVGWLRGETMVGKLVSVLSLYLASGRRITIRRRGIISMAGLLHIHDFIGERETKKGKHDRQQMDRWMMTVETESLELVRSMVHQTDRCSNLFNFASHRLLSFRFSTFLVQAHMKYPRIVM